MQDTSVVLEKYKRQPFATGLLPFRASVRSLSKPFPRIYAHSLGRQRWVIYDKNTKQPAIFSHAAVFAESDDQETGNYVPHGQVTPVGVDSKSVQHRPNLKCFYTYIFDTFGDMDLYEGMWSLDEYIGGLEGFNPSHLPRRMYLSGQDPRYRARFWMQTPMFLRRGSQDARGSPASHLHPWVVQADRDSKAFKANADRPRVWMKSADGIVPIGERSPGTLQKGDVVAVSFTVTYHVSSVNWFAQFHPADIVVVKEADVDGTDYSAPSLDLHSRPPPSLNNIPEEDSIMDDDEGEGVATGSGVEADGNRSGGEEVGSGPLADGGDDVDDDGLSESMEIDDAGPPSSPGSPSSELSAIEEGEFDFVKGEDADTENSDNEFVDLVAEEVEEKRGRRIAKGPGARAGRKRG